MRIVKVHRSIKVIAVTCVGFKDFVSKLKCVQKDAMNIFNLKIIYLAVQTHIYALGMGVY